MEKLNSSIIKMSDVAVMGYLNMHDNFMKNVINYIRFLKYEIFH